VFDRKRSVEKQTGPLYEACKCRVGIKFANSDRQPWGRACIETHAGKERIERDLTS
jgi:hypothetical protein